jgi:hypothetical protein
MIFNKINFRKHFYFILFFSAFFITGLFIFDDYGICWDEPLSHDYNGLINYNFILHGDYKLLANSPEKYHGPVIEILLVGIEKIFNMTDVRNIYQVRHLIMFFIFSLSLIYFYLINYKYFKSTFLALAGCVFLVLSPRIFSDAFYNYKDLTLLSLTIISVYTTMNFLRSPSFRNLFFHALVSALLIDIRITGIIIPFFTVVYFFIKSYPENNLKTLLKKNLLYLLILFAFIILFWPVLWRHPFQNFIEAYLQMKNYYWSGNVLFQGKILPVLQLPLEYIPVWIGITTPILYLILFIIGTVLFVNNISTTAKESFRNIFKYDFEWLNLYIILSSVSAVLLFKSVVYDGWRHLYFIYPSMIFFTIYALKFLIDYYKKINLSYVVYTIVIISCTSTAYSMIKLHPYEHIYFNKLAHGSLNDIKQRYEMDYWGLSYFEGLRYIVNHDKRDVIRIWEDTPPGETNSMMLEKSDRERLLYSSSKNADYYVTTYRGHPDDYPYHELYSVIRDDAKIMTVYEMTKKPETIFYEKDKIFTHRNDFNKPLDSWPSVELISKENSTSDKYANNKNTNDYSAAYVLKIDSAWRHSGKLQAEITFNLFSKESFKYQLVVQADSADGNMYFWKGNLERYSPSAKWINVKSVVEFPEVKPGDVVKIYMINMDHQTFMMDDFEVNIYDVKNSK